MRNRRRRFEAPKQELAFITSLSLVPVAAVWLIITALAMGVYVNPPHALTVDLPPPVERDYIPPLSPPANRLGIDRRGAVHWNDQFISDAQLAQILQQTLVEPQQPALLFEPDGDASYQRAVEVLDIVRQAGLLDGCFFFSNAGKFRRYEEREPDDGPLPAARRDCLPPIE